MKVLGVVQWATRDKAGASIAGVRPLFEIQKPDWRPVDAADEFPAHGQIFWPNAQSAVEGALIYFRVEPNPGQKDEFRVVEPKPANEVLDLRHYGSVPDVRAALAAGIELPFHFCTTRLFVRCAPDVLIGPIELIPNFSGAMKLGGTNLHHLSSFIAFTLKSVDIDGHTRLLRVDDGAPSAYVDWDDDAVVLRRAVEVAVRIAKLSGQSAGQTKKQIDDAARALSSPGLGGDLQLDLYRLERALTLLRGDEAVAGRAGELVEALRQHPAIGDALDALTSKVSQETERTVRADLDSRLSGDRAKLQALTASLEDASAQFELRKQDVRRLEDQIAELLTRAEHTARDAEATVQARVAAALNSPLELLAEASVLRPLLSARNNEAVILPAIQPESPGWTASRGERVTDRTSLRRSLTAAARARGVDPTLMMQIHTAIAAKLMPLVLGPAALSALVAYAHAVCGQRLWMIHVAPSVIRLGDLVDGPQGLLSAATAAKEIDGLSLVVLEGINRSPLEASMIPLLQLTELDLSPISPASGVRLAATQILGATTVPVSPQIWSHSVAVYPQPCVATPHADAGAGDMPLSSELLATGDIPSGVIDALLDVWPECADLRPTLSRYGSALSRLYDDEARISEALVSGVVLPYIACALSPEEQDDVLRKTGHLEDATAVGLRQLRRALR